MSSQVSTPNKVENGGCLPGGNPCSFFPLQLKHQGPAVMPLPRMWAHLWKKANKALGGLLAIKSSIDTLQQKLISEFGMALWQNNSETTESIKEAKAICAHSIQEAEDYCSVAIREAEAQRVSQAISLQQSPPQNCSAPWGGIYWKEERKGQLNFLSIFQTALWVSPPEVHRMLVPSYHILLGHAPTSHLFSIPQGVSTLFTRVCPRTSSPPCPNIHLGPKWWHHSPDLMDVLLLVRTTSQIPDKSQEALYLEGVRDNALAHGINKKPPRGL